MRRPRHSGEITDYTGMRHDTEMTYDTVQIHYSLCAARGVPKKADGESGACLVVRAMRSAQSEALRASTKRMP